jgi:hypothetical protein
VPGKKSSRGRHRRAARYGPWCRRAAGPGRRCRGTAPLRGAWRPARPGWARANRVFGPSPRQGRHWSAGQAAPGGR